MPRINTGAKTYPNTLIIWCYFKIKKRLEEIASTKMLLNDEIFGCYLLYVTKKFEYKKK